MFSGLQQMLPKMREKIKKCYFLSGKNTQFLNQKPSTLLSLVCPPEKTCSAARGIQFRWSGDVQEAIPMQSKFCKKPLAMLLARLECWHSIWWRSQISLSWIQSSQHDECQEDYHMSQHRQVAGTTTSHRRNAKSKFTFVTLLTEDLQKSP